MKHPFNFRAERKFSENISATFDFFRYNFKTIMKLIIRIPGPLVVFGLLFIIPYYMDIFDKMRTRSYSFNYFTMALFFIGMLIYSLGSMLSFATVNEFIGLYQKGRDIESIALKDVFINVRNNFWRFLGAYFLVMIIISAGFILLIVPGIYLAIALAFTFSVITNENKGVTDAIARSFTIIKGNWWPTFGFLIVLSILTVFVSYAVILPLSMLMGIMIVSSEPGGILSFLYALLNSLNLFFYFLVSVILYIGINIKYFSLVEKKEQLGLKEQIRNMDIVRDAAE